jgi:glycosyltransferase involved in cell wall biosynthesis
MKTSFIVLTYNRTDALLAVLESLAKQCNAHQEVIIADDGSRTSEVTKLFNECPAFPCPVKHVWHPDTGFTAATARNLGAHHASGDYLVFIDGDCIPNPSFVAAHARLAEAGYFVNGSRVLLSERLTREVLERKLDLTRQSLGFWIRKRLSGDSNKMLHVLGWPWRLFRVQQGFRWKGIRSCNLGLWKTDFVAVDGFDESFKGWGHEDADLVLRLCHSRVQRKNGFLATEVFHLWHRGNQRDNESVNRHKVLGRIKSGQVRAEKGLNQSAGLHSVKVTLLR